MHSRVHTRACDFWAISENWKIVRGAYALLGVGTIQFLLHLIPEP